MREFDRDGSLLCELQGRIFEKSAAAYGTSSAIFVRRYMNSDYASRMDRPGFIDRPTDAEEAFESLDAQYGASSYGSEIYSADELYWTGFIYRCWAYVHEIPSRSVYKICNAADMHSLYYAYHTMDPLAAIDRLMEAEGIPMTEEQMIKAGVEILRKIRSTKASD